MILKQTSSNLLRAAGLPVDSLEAVSRFFCAMNSPLTIICRHLAADECADFIAKMRRQLLSEA